MSSLRCLEHTLDASKINSYVQPGVFARDTPLIDTPLFFDLEKFSTDPLRLIWCENFWEFFENINLWRDFFLPFKQDFLCFDGVLHHFTHQTHSRSLQIPLRTQKILCETQKVSTDTPPSEVQNQTELGGGICSEYPWCEGMGHHIIILTYHPYLPQGSCKFKTTHSHLGDSIRDKEFNFAFPLHYIHNIK